MSDEEPRYPGQEPPHQPNWGSAYPPPGQSTPPPGYGYPPPGYPPPGYPPQGYGYGPVVPKHPNASTAMVLGIVGVAGGFLCWLPLLVSPVALFQGRKAMREIDASNGQLNGRSEAKAGFVLGIIGTVLLALALAFVVLIVVLSLTIQDFWGETTDDDPGTFDTSARTSLVATWPSGA
ncbi:DUF4190 domain-containing protein [Aeromicrobium chenweiae]|uniref:Uncharacterized protein n=1 Tax=Aeromicrobium chenweiae TaxID=2079793 RepID=A0A2S0WQ13_9ACTN|nr:DUF4190 domain-containing protein [Aeromicrobium chenweiae]AWB93435.1 hypothetical protein C3E78_15110 [Aeromicrobium chenweiae]TGN34427.1 DUF4190 domain-containing protein [Aeromicrobium chenweiae]